MQEVKKLIQIFNIWTKLKISIHISEVKKFPKERQVWWASLGQNVGVEINGKNEKFERPVLVLKRYNKDSLLILPISSKIKEGEYYFKFQDDMERQNIANLSQLRMISSKRFIRIMGKMNIKDFNDVKNKIKNLI